MCRTCYTNRPPDIDGYKFWYPKFGKQPSMLTLITGPLGSLMMEAILAQIQSGQAPLASDGAAFGYFDANVLVSGNSSDRSVSAEEDEIPDQSTYLAELDSVVAKKRKEDE